MAAAYIDSTYVDNAIGSGVRAAYVDSTALTQLINAASAVVKSAAKNSGHALGDTTSDDLVKLATFGVMLPMLYGVKGSKVPDQFLVAVNIADSVITGKLPLLETTPSAETAVGGNSFTESDATATDSVPQIFGRGSMTGY